MLKYAHKLHTKMLLLGLRLLDQAEEQLRQVADDDEGWGQCWTAVVLHNQVVSLELPEDVCVSLHYLKGVAERNHNKIYRKINLQCLIVKKL